MATSPRHSHDRPDWGTPTPLIEAARQVLGRIDLDPASSLDHNTRVRALSFFDETTDGLQAFWQGTVFLNPPGGLVRPFWARLLHHYEIGAVPAAIWIGFSLEQLQSLQWVGPKQPCYGRSPIHFPMCIPSKRLRFTDPRPGSRRQSPTHGNYITYLGPEVEAFCDVFSAVGVTRA